MLDPMEDLSDRIKKLRKELRLTQEGLGAAAGVTKQAVSQWERGLTAPERDALSRLQKSNRVNPDWVSSGTGEMIFPGVSALPANATRLAAEPLPPLLRELVEAARGLSERGLYVLIHQARQLANEYPAQAKPEQSSG
ncbi:MAG: helix-turn-helix transcriptional regulator [Pseudomonadota bacterium]|nr:helix-turn-helix transcriptional regulator [Pseudomonadota bacterium]